MKLLTLNCHSWQEKDQIDKIKYLAKVIKDKQYDVIALQEVSQTIKAEEVEGIIKKDNFALLLQQELIKLGERNYSYIWDYSHIGYDIYEEGLAIFTKHKIKEKRSFYISKSDEKTNYRSRNIVGVTIGYEDESIDFYSCHAGWWHDEIEPFKYQADRLVEQINSNRQSIIMGDFNNNSYVRDEGYDYLLRKGLKDTYTEAQERDKGITVKGEIAGWEAQSEDKRLDLILSTTQYNVISSKVIFNGENKEIISDHYGVEVIINN